MKNKSTQKFVELRDVWGNHARNCVEKEFRRKFIKGQFNIGLLRKINPRKVIAITVITINTPLPTASPITNPYLWKKVMKFNTDKFSRKINCFMLRFR